MKFRTAKCFGSRIQILDYGQQVKKVGHQLKLILEFFVGFSNLYCSYFGLKLIVVWWEGASEQGEVKNEMDGHKKAQLPLG